MSDEETLEDIHEEYVLLAHAMQTGVAFDMELDEGHTMGATTPKHLRVGMNSALVSHGGLTKLLVDKGIITELEYATAMRDAMKMEVERYEKHLQDVYGADIKLW